MFDVVKLVCTTYHDPDTFPGVFVAGRTSILPFISEKSGSSRDTLMENRIASIEAQIKEVFLPRGNQTA